MTEISIVPLGAGQDVGRSCIILTIGGKNIMLDCGMHMGFSDERRFPDFSYITRNGRLTQHIDCLIISHFHLDHCGALPYMTEMIGYDGPIYMTYPTKAICPILLEDFRKISADKRSEPMFTSEMIKNCMKKTTAVNLHQVVQVDDELEIKSYYAGHVLGAAMFHIRVGQQSVVYTGDYNMTPDRHLGAAWIDKVCPDVLITESTYATTIRDSKRCRERDFLKKIQTCIEKGGKVLIPVFALGRAQELCILLESYWERMNIQVPVYFSLGLTEKANYYYRLFISWTSQKIKETFVQRNMFEFVHIKPFDKSYIDNPGPMVVFATPGMLHAGFSLQIFRKWASNENNMVIMPGYCVSGTVGHKILNGQRKIEFENKQIVDVKMSVQYMSFSAHADAKGIMQLISQCEPRNVVLVHGETNKMGFLKTKIEKEFNIPCFFPANGETVTFETRHNIPVDISLKLLKREAAIPGISPPSVKYPRIMHGALLMRDNKLEFVDPGNALRDIGLTEHHIRFTSTVRLNKTGPATSTADQIFKLLTTKLQDYRVIYSSDGSITLSESVLVKVSSSGSFQDVLISWSIQDEDIGSYLLQLLKNGIES